MKLIDYGPNERIYQRYLYDEDTGEMYIRATDLAHGMGEFLQQFHSLVYEFNGERYVSFSDLERDFPWSADNLSEFKNNLVRQFVNSKKDSGR